METIKDFKELLELLNGKKDLTDIYEFGEHCRIYLF
jgi:hypothetical protein